MKNDFFKFLEDLGIGYKYIINGFIGSVVWSFYKKLKFLEALRQVFIGSLVAGYVTPLIAHAESIPPEFLSALSFVVGMMGMIIIDTIYKYIKNKVNAFKKGSKIVSDEESKSDLEV